jgi:hypothetical protein
MAHSKKPKQTKYVAKSKLPKEKNEHGGFYRCKVSFSFKKYDAGAPWANDVTVT